LFEPLWPVAEPGQRQPEAGEQRGIADHNRVASN
jgi:hypothetical protein